MLFWLYPFWGKCGAQPTVHVDLPCFAGVGYGSAGHHSLHCLPTSTPVLALAGVKGGCCGDVRIWDKASGIGLNTQGSTELQRQDHPCK